MSLFSKFKALFGDSTPAAAQVLPSVEYNGFTITPEPQPEGGQYRVSGWVRKDELEHQFIRADILPSQQACADEMIRKAQIMIDQRGESLFS